MNTTMPLAVAAAVIAGGTFFAGCGTRAAAVVRPAYRADFAATNGFAFSNYRLRTAHSIVSNETGVALRFTGLGSTDPKTKDTAWTVKTPTFAVTTNARFAVRLVMSGDVPSCGAIRPGASLEWFDAANKALVTTDALGKDVPLVTQFAIPTRREDRGIATAITKGEVPAGARHARLTLNVDNPDLFKGEVLEIRELEYFEKLNGDNWFFGDTEPPELEVLSSSPSADTTAALKVRFNDASSIDGATVAFEINGKSTLISDWTRCGNTYTYRPKTPWTMNSVVRVKAAAADTLGNSGTSWGFMAITTNRVAHPRWSIRDDGMMLKDGEPVFPLGITSVHACPWNGNDLDRGLKLMKENGINAVHTYMVRNRPHNEQSVHYPELVAACAKYGIMLYAEPATRETGYRRPALSGKAAAEREAMLADNLIYSRSGSAGQAFWGIGDDTTALLLPHQLKRNHQFCKAVDPDVLTISADVSIPPPQHARYIPYADVLMLECYPMRKATPQPEEMAIFAKTLDDGWQATRLSEVANRSVMAMPQVFKGWSSWKRYPTAAEIRTEFYLAIACRARGIIAYSSYSYKGNEGPFNDPVHQAEFLSLTREISALIPSLVKRDAARQPVIAITQGPKNDLRGGAAIRCLLKEDGLLVAVNVLAEPVTAEIRLPSGKALTHAFAPGGVLVERP